MVLLSEEPALDPGEAGKGRLGTASATAANEPNDEADCDAGRPIDGTEECGVIGSGGGGVLGAFPEGENPKRPNMDFLRLMIRVRQHVMT